MEANQNLQDGVEKFLAFTTPLIEQLKVYEWSGSDNGQWFDFLIRSTIIRQTEALQSMLLLAKAKHGHFGVTLLRPAFEELVWLEYFLSQRAEANELSHLFSFKEVCDSINAQNDYSGVKGMASIGFTQREVKKRLAQSRENSARIGEIGRRLGWNMNRSLLPSMSWLTRKVGRERDYKFLYHATSRFVHFSAHELFRRVWGKHGSVTIASSNFTAYWTDFALYWGFRIYVDLCIATVDVFPNSEMDDQEWKNVQVYLKEFSQVPIITKGELESWNV